MSRFFVLVLCSALLAACGGGEEPTEPAVTVTDTATETETPTFPGATATGDAIEVEAEDTAFDTSSIEAAAGTVVNIEFKNRDPLPHSISFNRVEDPGGSDQEIFRGEIITGPDAEVTYLFLAPEAGSYFFRCDIHRTQMTGTFTVS